MLLTQKARPARRLSRRGVNDIAKLTCWALDITLISSSRVTKKLNKGDVWVKSMRRHYSFFDPILKNRLWWSSDVPHSVLLPAAGQI